MKIDYHKIAYELWNNNWLDKESIDDAAALIQQMVEAVPSMEWTCWLCKNPKTGEPAYVSHSPLSGDFKYCAECWNGSNIVLPMSTAPRDGSWVKLVTKDGLDDTLRWDTSYSIHGLGGNWTDGTCNMSDRDYKGWKA